MGGVGVSAIGAVMFAFLIIATCGESQAARAFSWVMVAVVGVVMLTIWLVGFAFGIEVRI